MSRILAVSMLVFAIARPAQAACDVWAWNQKVFDSDAIHYAAADLDGDGIAEILSTSATTVTYRRYPAFTPVVLYTATSIGAPVAGDVTGDGKIDLVIPRTDNTLVVLPGNGNATFGTPVLTNLTTSPVRFVLGNFSGDAKLDVAMIGSAASLQFLQGNGTGSFTLAGSVAIAAAPRHLVHANFDGDGYDDVAISHAGSATVDVVFANGSGGAAATVSLSGGDTAMLATADFDGDSDPDLYAARPVEDRLDVFPNTGARTFGAAIPQDLWSESPDPMRAMALLDRDDDADLDVVVARPGYLDWIVRELTGNYVPWFTTNFTRPYPWAAKDNGHSLAVADFTGDGRTDVVLDDTGNGRGVLMINACGPAALFVGASHIITLGQTPSVNVQVWAGHQQPAPTGTVRLSWEGGEKTVTLIPHQSQPHGYYFGLPLDGSIPLGFQPIVGEYSGDANYPPSEYTTYLIVTTDTTTTTLDGPTEWTYGEQPTYTATVTSSTGDTPKGYINFGVDDSWLAETTAPAGEWKAPSWIGAGTHTIKARMGYSETHPPSSDSMQVTVKKAKPAVSLGWGTLSRAGEAAEIRAWVTPAYTSITGIVKLMEGANTLGSATVASPEFLVSGLSAGTHTLHFVYEGDANWEAATSATFEHTVMPAGTALHLVATGSDAFVRLDLLRPSNVSSRIWRRVLGGPWTFVAFPAAPVHFDENVTPGTVYQYHLDNAGQTPPLQSAIDTVYAGPFTDATLNGVTIKKTHFTELQTALNKFRAMAGLTPLAIDFTGIVRASHLTQMRTAINEARVALGLPAYPFGAAPTPGATVIRAADLHQLREALR